VPSFLQDIRYALRQLRKSPGFTAAALLTLALGIGATTAIFTLVHAVLLQSLPVKDPSGLVRVGDIENCCENGGMETDWALFSWDLYKTFRDHTPGFAELAAFQSEADPKSVRRQGSSHPADSVSTEFVSGNAFSVLGIRPYAGRLLESDDDRKGAPQVAVMSYRSWQQKYGQDPSVVGSAYLIDGVPFTIVGIAPPGFFGEQLTSNPASFWMPLSSEPLMMKTNSLLDHADVEWLNLIGRLAHGANEKQVEAQMQLELRQWLLSPVSEVPAPSRSLIPQQTLHLSPGGAGVHRMADDYRSGLHLLMWISAFVLLIACANLANLTLVRSTARRQQASVRTALGAPRARLVRQALTESVTLSLLGGAAGLAIAFAGTRLILHLAFQRTYVPISATPSLPVMLFAFAAALVTGALFGIAPAWFSTHADPVEALRGANRSTGGRDNAVQKALVIVQAAISVVLLCAAGLLTQSLRNLHNQDFGFDVDHRYVLHSFAQMAGYQSDQLDSLYRQLHDSIAAIPGVASVSFSLNSPMDDSHSNFNIFIEGQAPPNPGDDNHSGGLDRVSADYFQTLGTKILDGRPITGQDTAATRPVAVVNATFAKRYFGRQNPIGKHFGVIDQKYAGSYEIVGVAEDAEYDLPPDNIRPMYFIAGPQHISYTEPNARLWENSLSYMSAIVINTHGNVPNMEAKVRAAVAQVNPSLPINDFHTFADQVNTQFEQRDLIVTLTSLFGALALVLASIGLYGVTAYTVEGRRSEIGLRMALGADRPNVLRLVLRGAFMQVAIGLALGIPAAALAGHFMASQLFGTSGWNPVVLFVTTIVLCAAAFVAAVIPARRAASVDPMQALRNE
jgi:predicted permease